MKWFEHHPDRLPKLSENDWEVVEYLTGRIPLLLRSLFEFQDKSFDETKFLECPDLVKVNNDITSFYHTMIESF